MLLDARFCSTLLGHVELYNVVLTGVWNVQHVAGLCYVMLDCVVWCWVVLNGVTLREESNAEKSPAEQKNAELKNANLVQNFAFFYSEFFGNFGSCAFFYFRIFREFWIIRIIFFRLFREFWIIRNLLFRIF